MRKLNLIIGLSIGLILTSCSSNDENIQLSIEELLVKNSPWTFHHYELINIIDAGNSTFTKEDIENDVNFWASGNVITFNEDETGSSFTPGEETDTWQWEVTNNNQLKLTFDGGGTDILEKVSVSSSQFIIEIESVSFDENAVYEVLHYGKFIFQ